MTGTFLRTFGTVILMCALTGTGAVAQEADEADELAKKLQNPVAALISVPFQSNFEWGGGPHSDGFKYTLNTQPVIPISIAADWNLISRTRRDSRQRAGRHGRHHAEPLLLA